MSREADQLRIVVSGMVAANPGQGGATWAVLQYILGLSQLGHEVVFVEECAEADLRPKDGPLTSSENTAYFKSVMAEHDIEDSAALLVRETKETIGLPFERLVQLAGEADVLLNISGILTDKALTERIPVRAYLDLDPAFNQLWHESGIDMRFDGHTHFVTVGQAIGTAESDIPTCNREWIATVPPVVLDEWPGGAGIDTDAFTTVGNWRAYGSIERNGVSYGQKAHSLREFIGLPTRTAARFVLALTIHPDERKDLEALERNRWGLVDAAEVAGTPSDYRRFLSGSLAELGVAKSGYVLSRSGWFSDRSTCYLACGRPVVAQETGFSRFLPTGEGLFAFESEDDAVAAVAEVQDDYALHSRAARRLAEEQFDSDKVLTRLLEKLGSAS